MSQNIGISNEHASVEVATGFGPRIVGLTPPGGPNLLADLGDLAADLPDGRRFFFRGGHRLWLAPERLDLTYEPDNEPVAAGATDTTAYATGIAGGIEKTIRVTAARDRIVVDHTVANRGARQLDVALWAITQFLPGGTALLPLGDNPADPQRLQASSRVVGWPYTDWSALQSPPDHNLLVVDGERTSPTKIGTELTEGWLGYRINGWLFAKFAELGASPVDLGATGQIYACADFVELETLGPLVHLAPEAVAHHRETWRLWPDPGSIDGILELVEACRVK